jgi:peptide/nickel transport system permease protein
VLVFLVRRSIQALPVIALTTVLVFLLLHFAPGDPIRMLASPAATDADIQRIRERVGLDRPLPVQYATWLANAVRGDLGESIRSGVPVTEMLPGRMWNTLRLTLAAMVITVGVGLTAGILAAARAGSWVDVVTMTISVLGLSLPPFWLALMLMMLFSVRLDWLPAGGGDSWRHIILPAISLGLASAALVARMARSSMLEVTRADYMRTARAKGLTNRRILLGHGLRNSLIPTVTVIGLEFGTLLAGAVITETIFAWPGLGSLLVSSILNRDFPVVQATLLVIATSFVFVNLLTDLVYTLIDPRINLE